MIRTIPPETRIIFYQVLWHSVKNLKASSFTTDSATSRFKKKAINNPGTYPIAK